jgi:wyosine [tRNA(Phe)-imidazoG37] synthetase (radical SAM superfamily)
MHYQYLFGPVPSRRLGVSLGIDLVPWKTCSFNCIYCECGATTNLTLERKEYVPTEEVIVELDEYLSGHPLLDYITFSGSGEPTLHNGIGTISHHIKAHFPDYKTALLTNGCFFWDRDVRDEVKEIDVVIPSLDAATPEMFRKIDRPHHSLDITRIIQGLVDLRKEYPGQIWIEIFVVPGMNTIPHEIEMLRNALFAIQPDKVQLNTLDRPGVVDWITPAPRELLEKIARDLQYPGVEIPGTPSSRSDIASFSEDIMESVLGTIRRRPCTVEDLSAMYGLHPNEINKYIQYLLDQGKIEAKREARGTFFSIRS